MKKNGGFEKGGVFSKRGQLTLFIVIAIIVVGIIVFFASVGNLIDRPIKGSEGLRDSIVECLDFTTGNSFNFVSYQGGYNRPPEKYFSFDPTFYPYYYYEGEVFVPSIDVIEGEMAEYVVENLADCLNDINSSGFDVSYGKPNVKVGIGDDEVEYIVDMQILIERDENVMTLELSKFPVYYPSNFLKLYEVSKFYIEDLVNDPDYYCISCISEMSERDDFYFYIFNILEDVGLVMVFEKGESPLIMNFVTKFGSNQTNNGE